MTSFLEEVAFTAFWGTVSGICIAYFLESVKPGMILSFLRTGIALLFLRIKGGWNNNDIKNKKREFELHSDFEYYVTDLALQKYKAFKPLLGCSICSKFWLNVLAFFVFSLLSGFVWWYFIVFFSFSYAAFIFVYIKN